MDQKTSVALTGADREILFRTVIETAVDGIIVIDERGKMLLVNYAAERLFGYTPDEVLGHNVSMLMPEPYRSQHDGYIERYLAEGGARIIGIGREVPALRKDGSTFPMYLSVGEGWLGPMRIFLGIIHDLTERRARESEVHQLQNELQHALRLTAMGQLTSALAHELNQPLTAVMNYMNAARRGLQSSADPAAGRALELLDKAVAQTGRAGQIIRRLREFIEKKEPDRRLEDLNTSVEEAVALGLVGAADNDVEIETSLEPGLPQILFDRIQIQQVVVNLLRNGVEALAADGTRKIAITTTRTSGGFVEIAVCDSGPGIAPDVEARLFQPFATTKTRGLGMGLSICKGIVEAHGGRIWVAPNPGGGTQFRFRLPVPESAEG